MLKKLIPICPGLVFFFMVFSAGLLFPADNRHALVIGNGNYRDNSISALANPVNDAADVAAVLKELGYNVTLKTNIGLRDMISAVEDFTLELRRGPEIEGFFWFAGHGLSVRGIHYMLPVDVDPANDNIIARGSYSVDDLMDEIGNARNRTNLIVIDACRNTLLPGGSRSVGARGLTVLAADDYRVSGNKIVYSTMAGRTAADGVPGSRNSPFAQAFISNIQKPESFDDVFLDIANETMRLTRGEQQPYAMGSFAVKSYTLSQNPSAASPAQAASAPISNLPATEPSRANPASPQPSKPPRDPAALSLDGKKVISINVAPWFDIGHLGFGASTTLTFFERYKNYGDFFFVPNSFFVSAGWLQSSEKEFRKDNGEWSASGNYGFGGGIFDLGALWKIRLGADQRFITNFGLSFSLFIMHDNINFIFTKKDSYSAQYEVPNAQVAPGLGVFAGLGFRFSRLVSLDFGMSLKGAFTQEAFAGKKKVDVPSYAGSSSDYPLGDELIYKDTYWLPFFLIGNLGVTFWFPR